MKKKTTYFKFILKLFFIFVISNEVCAKNLEKYYKGDKISSYFSGMLSLSENDYSNSYKFLKQLSGLEEHHHKYSLYYQHSLINLERIKEAFDFAKALEKEKLDSFDSNLIIGVYYLKNEKNSEALKYFKKLKASSADGTLNSLLSKSLNSWASFSDISENDAINLVDQISSRFDRIKQIQKIFAYCFYNSNLTNARFKELTSSKDSEYSRYNFFHANYLDSIGKKKNAIEVVELTLKKYPRNLIINQLKEDLLSKDSKKINNKFSCRKAEDVIAEIFYIVSNALASQSIYGLSNFYLNLAKYLNPNFISFDTLYAENYYATENLEGAKKIYKKIQRKGSFYNWFASKIIANIMIKQKKNDEAVKFLSNSFNNLPETNVFQMYDFAVFLKENEKFNESKKYFTKVLNLIDKKHFLYPKAKDGRGVTFERLGNWEKAEKDFLDSLSVSPDQAYVINYLAYSWIEKGMNIEKSMRMLEKANKLKSNDGYIIDSLGWALFKLKKYEDAMKYLQIAVRIMPNDPVVNDHYGDSLWFNNKNIQARYYWNYVLNLEEAEEDLKASTRKKLIHGIQSKL